MSTHFAAADLFEMHNAENRRENSAGDNAEQHRDVGDEALAPFDQRQNDQQHEQRDAEPGQSARRPD
jgi:hypothetical protein